MANFQELYKTEITQKLMKEFNYDSVMQVPQIEKITLNMGLGEALTNKKIIEHAVSDMALISGQKPIVVNAKKSVAGFKVREGYPNGCKVTLRSKRMYEFLERLIRVAIPRIRDFRGFSSRSFDGCGNYSLGIREQIVFPEINAISETACSIIFFLFFFYLEQFTSPHAPFSFNLLKWLTASTCLDCCYI